MKVTPGWNGKMVVSLCDFSGNWAKPWREAGYSVAQFDLKHGDDVCDVGYVLRQVIRTCAMLADTVDVVLAAPPCTDFSVSGAQYWPRKDADGTTDAALRVLDACTIIIEALKPRVWALENPVGRIPTLRPSVGRPGYYFNPHEYAGYLACPEPDRYTKRTGIWGNSVKPETSDVAPIRFCKQGSWLQLLGGKSERTKELRSMTPMGFAHAFFEANKGE